MTELKKIEKLTNKDIIESSKDSFGNIDLMEALVLFLEREVASKKQNLIAVENHPKVSDY